MGRILLFVVLGGLGVWAYARASSGPPARALSDYANVQPERVSFVPIPVYVPPPSNRTGSTNGPRVGGGGFSSGK